MIAASLFSGIGSPECAMPGWEWPWHAEIEKFPSAVMASRHSGSINLGDVSADGFTDRAAAIAKPNIIVFGSPCQSYSIAGKRLGLDDPRGNLTLIALGIVARLEPDWFTLENVPDFLSSWSGAAEGPDEAGAEWEGEETSDFAAFLGQVDDLGYSLSWTVLDAQYAGLAQRRERIFAVGHRRDWRAPASVLFEPESLCGYYPPSRKARERVAPTLSARTKGGGGLGTDFDIDGGLISGTVSSKWVKGSGAPAGDECYNLVAHALRADGFDASEDGTGRGTPLVAFSCKDDGGDAQIELSPTPRAGGFTDSHANAGVMPAIAWSIMPQNSGKDFKARQVEVAQPLMAGGPTTGNQGGDYIQSGHVVRRLTPRECERLQGFEDDYTLIDYRGKPAADGPRYKALGNSMAVPVMRWILSRIEQTERRMLALPSQNGNTHDQ